jgi:uncharacterized protein with von Willebrand factor type A (vWA) domain
MDVVLTNFIRALRNADVRVSTSETLDAFNTVQLIGYENRATLKQALSLVLPKTLDEKTAFDACFDRFFARRPLKALTRESEASQEGEATGQSSEDASSEGNASGPGAAEADASGSSQSNGADGTAAADDESGAEAAPDVATASSPLGQLLMRGSIMEIEVEIHAAGEQVGVQRIKVFTQKGVYTQRILEAMGNTPLQQEIAALARSAAAGNRQLGVELNRRRDWLREMIRGYVEHQFLLHADVTGRRLREDLLKNVRLASIDARHHRLVQDVVRRMARRLVAAYSRRRKVFHRGQLHLPRTLRHNMKYDDAIFDLKWKSTRVARPRVFAICDVSGSVANYAAFMLMFLYSLDEVLPKVRSFVFSSELDEVSGLFQQYPMDEAMALALRQYGNGATDYGRALADFSHLCLDEIDKQTTIIILGDGRNNFGDSRLDLMKQLYDRCQRLIWLNPEARSIWNTGDSEMRHFAAYCHQVDECSTLTQLERFVSGLLRYSR